MVDEASSPSKGWAEIDAMMKSGGLSEKEEVILFQMAQAGETPSYEGRQTRLEEYEGPETGVQGYF